MSGYLRRLATTGAAYTAASILSKVIAVALLPLYTRYLTPADYGAAEVIFAAVVSASIVVRLGTIEALLRFYYRDDEDPDRVIATSFAALFWVASSAALIALPFAGQISEALFPRSPAGLTRSLPDLVRISIGGLWVLTMFEYLLTLFRLEERARAFFVTTILNVLVTIGLTVVLVVGQGEGARGLLLGSYASGGAFVLALIVVHWRRLSLRVDRPLLRRLMRFGLPTMPAELSLYLLNFVDRIIIVRSAGLPAGGALLAGGQVRPGRQRPRPRLPARLAAARLLDPRRRRGAGRLRGDRHLVRRRLRLRRHRHVAALALDRARPRRPSVLRLLQGDRPDLHRGHPLRPLPGARRHPRQDGSHRLQLPGGDRGAGLPTSPSTSPWSRRWASSAPGSPWSPPTSSSWR